MKPLSEWNVAEITNEIGRYENRKEWLRVDFAERTRLIDEGIDQLKADLARRKTEQGAT